jgi:uridine kinase
MRLIAITGGSGAGKTWFADRLCEHLQPHALCLSLDDFYRNHAHLPAALRARQNFDHPRAIDWPLVRRVLADLRAGKSVAVPQYDFVNHCRSGFHAGTEPRPVLVMEGLWLLLHRDIRELFDWRIYLDCPETIRLRRRLVRDIAERGRDVDSVREQFAGRVAPMHRRFVAPQAAWAHIVVPYTQQGREAQRIGEALAS